MSYKIIICPNCNGKGSDYSGEGSSTRQPYTCVQPHCLICHSSGKMMICYACNTLSVISMRASGGSCSNCGLKCDYV